MVRELHGSRRTQDETSDEFLLVYGSADATLDVSVVEHLGCV